MGSETLDMGTVKTEPKAETAESIWRNLFVRPEMGTFMLLILSIIAGSLLSPYFADLEFILDSSSMFIEYGIAALILTYVIIAAQIDLSMASNMALSACITAVLFQLGIPMGLALFLGLLTGLVLGWLNGWIVTKFELPPIIVTIGTLALYRGIAMILMGDESIGRFPEWFVGLDTRYVGSTFIPYPLVMFMILAVILWLILNFTLFGRYVFAIGTNEQAAKYSGIPVKRLKLILFSVSGLFSAFAGIVMMSRLGVVRYDLADGGILDIVTIALLGGVDINGGRGNIGGTVIALFTLIVLRLGLSVANVKIENQLAIIGSLLILSITLSNYIYSKRSI